MLSAVSGFLISWCSPEARVPRLRNRSIRRIRSSISMRSVTSRRWMTQPSGLARGVLQDVGIGPGSAATARRGPGRSRGPRPQRCRSATWPARAASGAPPGRCPRAAADALGSTPRIRSAAELTLVTMSLAVRRDDALVHAGEDVEGEQLDLVQHPEDGELPLLEPEHRQRAEQEDGRGDRPDDDPGADVPPEGADLGRSRRPRA